MRQVSTLLVLVMTLVGGVSGARLRAESAFALTVRLYNSSGVPASALLTARSAAEPIFSSTGLDVTFRHCGRAGTPLGGGDPCDDPLKPSEVVVRIIDAPAFNVALDPRAFGMTYVVEATGRGWLATVFSDRINAAAARADIDSGTLLGRVLAHEVGHLLLGQGYHGDAGLMRAEWSDDVLHRERAGEWRFSMLEAAVMQRRLQSVHAR